MASDGCPLPVAWTLTGLPFQVPVNPKQFLTEFTSRAFSKKVSAIHLARSGAPGNSTASAKSPGWAELCGVIESFLVFSSGYPLSSRPHKGEGASEREECLT